MPTCVCQRLTAPYLLNLSTVSFVDKTQHDRIVDRHVFRVGKQTKRRIGNGYEVLEDIGAAIEDALIVSAFEQNRPHAFGPSLVFQKKATCVLENSRKRPVVLHDDEPGNATRRDGGERRSVPDAERKRLGVSHQKIGCLALVSAVDRFRLYGAFPAVLRCKAARIGRDKGNLGKTGIRNAGRAHDPIPPMLEQHMHRNRHCYPITLSYFDI